MLNTASIANKFRLSYLLFTLLLCAGFLAIFHTAETQIERRLVESRLIQQLYIDLKNNNLNDGSFNDSSFEQDSNSGITIYPFQQAPQNLQALATDKVQELDVVEDGVETELHFFKYTHDGQTYILSYLEKADTDKTQYPVLAIFEHLEDVFYQALLGAIALAVLMALLFSYVTSNAIIKPILQLKQAVASEGQALGELTNLPSEVGVLARAIEDKNQKLSQYLAREQLFTGDVSHELRTPLTIIMGSAEVLESQLPANSPSLEFIHRIYSTAKDTSDMISALLLLSRAPEQLDSPKTCIYTIVAGEVDRLAYLIRHKPVTCRVQVNGGDKIDSVDSSDGVNSSDGSGSDDRQYHAFVRPELLKMAVGNLIKNAMQYTDSGEVVIGIDDEKISISDTGQGIPEEVLPQLFKRFERLPSASAELGEGLDSEGYGVEGTGLGLSIVHRIITHLGWHLTHYTNASGGSTFEIFYHSILD